jgi:hypothetical protein
MDWEVDVQAPYGYALFLPTLPGQQYIAVQKRLDDYFRQVCEREPRVEGRRIHPVLDDTGDSSDQSDQQKERRYH